ncbi:MAG: hypothetical protein HC824_15080 [Synechococcales cyanobacterium RM1_1_8]|nr:hypothetical protein [Synechococcales cyanobacterium RM1_1_8]
MTTNPVPDLPDLEQAAHHYLAQLLQTGVPLPAATTIALAIARFERNQGRPNPTAHQLIRHYKAQICRANLWRFQLLSTTSLRRISTRFSGRT